MDKSLLRPVPGPIFAKCMGDVKHVTLGDNLCPDCEIISEAEYIAGVLDRFRDAIAEAHATLSADLKPCAVGGLQYQNQNGERE